MSHNHNHSHNHHHTAESFNQAFAIAVAVNFVFVIIEAWYAYWANSMSLFADAGHNLGDVLGLAVAWIANWLLSRHPSERYSYGFKRTTIIAALINALLLVATSALIAYESFDKIFAPEDVQEVTVIVVALIGIAINGGTALLFMRGRHSDLNVKGAFLHLAYDALISLGVVFTGIAIYYTNWNWLDPAVGLLIVLTILFGTWELLRDSTNLILDAVPHGVDQQAVRSYLQGLKGVTAVHDLHIWGLSTREVALTAHLVMPASTLSDDDHRRINEELFHHYHINHITLQVEQSTIEDPCGQSGVC